METTTDRSIKRISTCMMLQGVLLFLVILAGVVLLAVSMSTPAIIPDRRLDELLMHTNYRVDLLTDRVSRIEAKLPRTGSPTGEK